MPTSRTKFKPTERPKRAEAVAGPICRRLLTIQQAADVAGVPVERICRWVRTRKLEAYVLAGGIRIDEVELADCISSPASRQP
jgi:excisionase family DNA binding protein